ncbi:MAG: 16S rRNA (uracil(1498)-N(3))-methyltransferase [bacterium]|nr:16S rRNA (uracil(1498)-N(3))-methyltransferase [bacterium]
MDYYFYTPPQNIFAAHLIISDEESHHIKNVLRYRIGDKIKVVDGVGFEYIVAIKDYKENDIICSILDKKEGCCDPRCKVTLFQAIPKGRRMDIIVEKTTELGIYRIVPITTIHSVSIPKSEKLKLSRWNKIAISAMKQSKGTILPVIDRIISFDEAVKNLTQFDLSLIAHEKENITHIKDVIKRRIRSGKEENSIAIFIGPEGGFTEEEIGLAKMDNVIPVSLGKRRLRTETAAIVAIALILAMRH